MEIITIATPSLGDRSYVLVDDGVAAVIDPQRDLDRILPVLDARGLRVSHVFETHVHNDYVTGGLELARRTGAAYVLAAHDEVSYERVGARDGDEFQVGALVVRAVHTPGHTPHHLSYVVLEGGQPAAVFTGGSMLFGTVGRTDLITPEATDELSRRQYHSVRRLAGELPAETSVHPTHGFGSFCSSTTGSESEASTIGAERQSNIALTVADEDTFVDRLVGGLTAYPRYYAYMAPINRAGPAPADLSPTEAVDGTEIRRRIDAGEWVVDLRSRTAFARRHLAGTLNFEGGDSFVTYLGWMLPWGTSVTLVGDTPDEIAEAQRQMLRIGIDRPAGSASGGLKAWAEGGDVGCYRTATFVELADARSAGSVTVLDVRRDDEWKEGRIDDAIHIPLHDLQDRIAEVPEGEELWVHCASGYRASVAASLLDRAGRTVVVIDDEWERATKLDGLTVAATT